MTEEQREIIADCLNGVFSPKQTLKRLHVSWGNYYKLIKEYKRLYYGIKEEVLIEEEMIMRCEEYTGSRYEIRKKFWYKLCQGG